MIRILLLLLITFTSYGQLVRQIGYVTAAEVALHPQMTLGDYMIKDRGHTNIRLYIIQNEQACSITDNSGDALFTDNAHGLTTGTAIRVKKSKYYNGYGTANVINANTFKITKLDGTTLAFNQNESNSFWTLMYESHDEKNFSLGVNSQGKACYDKYQISGNLADFRTSYAYNNHNADGTLRAEHGNFSNYTGPIGDRLWFVFEDITVPITNNGSGHALATLTNHGIPNGYVVLKTEVSSYATRLTNNHWYLESVNANTFRFKTNATGSYMPFTTNANVTFSIVIDASKMEGIDIAGSEDNPVIATNTEGQTIFRRSYESGTSYGYDMWGGVSHFRFTGQYDPILRTGDVNYQGREINKLFPYGEYGIEFQFGSSPLNNTIFNVGDGANYVEVDHVLVNGEGRGFAGMMFKTDGYGNLPVMDVSPHDNIITDTHGEGTYIGYSTANVFGSPQTEHAVRLNMYNNIFARSGVEICQTGQLWTGSRVAHNVFFISSTTRYNPFYIGQSTHTQFKTRGIGNIFYEYNIGIGGGVQAITVQTDIADEVGDGSAIYIRKCVWQDNCGRLVYYNNTNMTNTPLIFEDVWLKRVSPYDTDRNESQPVFDGLILENDVTTKFVLQGLHIDNGMSSLNLIDGTANSSQRFPHVTYEDVPEVEFQGNGYEGINLRDVTYWERNFKAGHPTHPSEQIHRNIGEIVLYHGRTYKVITNHDSDIAPDTDVTNYVQLFWDVNGIRSDYAGYSTPYSYSPPLDFRQKANTFFNIKRMGIYENMPNTNYLYHYWQVAEDDSGSPDLDTIKDLPKFYNMSELEDDLIDFVGTGKHVRRITVKSGTQIASNWIQL